MKAKFFPLFLTAIFLGISPTFGDENVLQARWHRAQAMFQSLHITPQTRLGLDFTKDFHQNNPDLPKLETYLNIFRNMKRLQSHILVLNWILQQPDTPTELRTLAEQRLIEVSHEKRKILNHQDISQEVDQKLLNWDKKQIPPLQKKYPDFFDTGEKAVETKLLTQLGPQLKKGESLNLTPIEGRYWGWRPLKLIQSLVIHHTETSDIDEIYHKHISEGRFEGDLAPFIAYHFLIDTRGNILFLNALGEKVWHARGANGTSIGIALLGNLDEGQATPAQFDSLKKLTQFLVREFPINPRTGIHGHGELTHEGNDTNCPGAFGREVIKQLTHQLSRSL